jgi:flagellar biosynthesis/type III secretory pathway M-ring protein FliF/YscJ
MAEAPPPPSLLERLAGWQEALWRAGGLAVILLVGLMVVRPFLMAMVSRAAPLPVAELETTATVEEKEDYVINQPVMENQALTMIARNHPEQTALVIKHWVSESD